MRWAFNGKIIFICLMDKVVACLTTNCGCSYTCVYSITYNIHVCIALRTIYRLVHAGDRIKQDWVKEGSFYPQPYTLGWGI